MKMRRRLVHFVVVVVLISGLSVFAIEKNVPVPVDPGFELSLAKGWVLPKGLRLSISEKFSRSGGKSLLIESGGGPDNYVRQKFKCDYSKPMLISGYFKAENVKIDPGGWARLYVHVLYEGKAQTSTAASHFYADIPPGTYGWKRFSVAVRPEKGYETSRIWISVGGSLKEGRLYADDITIEALPAMPAFAGCEASAWKKADEAVMITDLSKCSPKSALSDKRKKHHWKVLEYDTGTFTGKCVAAMPKTDAPPLTLPLNAKGWHAVYVGLGGLHTEGNTARLKLSSDAAYQYRSHGSGQIQEVFFKCADLTGQKFHLAQQSAGRSRACTLYYVKLVPLTETEVKAIKADAGQRETKKLISTIDGFSFIHDRFPTTKEELLEEFEHYRGSDFGTIWWQYSGADEVNYKSKFGTINGQYSDDFPREGDRFYTETVKTLIAKGVDITKVAVDAAHSMDIEIQIGVRPAAWQGPPPYEDYFISDFYKAHREWRCFDRDGTEVTRMSFAIPQVRRQVLNIIGEVLEAGPDGINIMFNRGGPLVLWEDAFCEMFKEKYGADAREVEENDPRIYELRAEVVTTFLKEVRRLLDETQKSQKLKKRLKLSVLTLSTKENNQLFGLDVEGWIKEGLIDSIGIANYSSGAPGKPMDIAYYKNITSGSSVPFYPMIVAWQIKTDEKMLSQSLDFYDAGANGILFWDPSGTASMPLRWPIMSRLGHIDESKKLATMGKQVPVTNRIKKLGDYVYSRWSAWAGF